MSPVHRHNQPLVAGEIERPRNARVWDVRAERSTEPGAGAPNAQPPAAVESARPPSGEASPDARIVSPVNAVAPIHPARRVESRATPSRSSRGSRAARIRIAGVVDELMGVRRRAPAIPFGIPPATWAQLSPDTRQSFRALARRLVTVLR